MPKLRNIFALACFLILTACNLNVTAQQPDGEHVIGPNGNEIIIQSPTPDLPGTQNAQFQSAIQSTQTAAVIETQVAAATGTAMYSQPGPTPTPMIYNVQVQVLDGVVYATKTDFGQNGFTIAFFHADNSVHECASHAIFSGTYKLCETVGPGDFINVYGQNYPLIEGDTFNIPYIWADIAPY